MELQQNGVEEKSHSKGDALNVNEMKRRCIELISAELQQKCAEVICGGSARQQTAKEMSSIGRA